MPRSAALAALILAAGIAPAEAQPAPAESPLSAAALKQMQVTQPGLKIVSMERKAPISPMEGWDVVATVSNDSPEAVPDGSHGIELRCTSPTSGTRAVRRALRAIDPHGQLRIAILKNEQYALAGPAPAPTPNPLFPPLPKPQPNPFGSADVGAQPLLTAALAWSCSAAVATGLGRAGIGASNTLAWGPEFDYAIGDVSFEKATATRSVNVRVAVLASGIPSFLPFAVIPRTLRLECSKPGSPAKTAELPAAATVLFGTSHAELLPFPATGWTCKATVVGPGADKDPSNDSRTVTAP